ncbi:hypothetical protein ACQ4PT_059522 [Festuca glaucescens]
MQDFQSIPGLAGRLFGGAAAAADIRRAQAQQGLPASRCGGFSQAPPEAVKCPRCDSTNTKFCYYNNYNLSQPRHFCKSCRRYWTKGGVLRNVPVGGGCRKAKRSSSSSSSAPSTPAATEAKNQRRAPASSSGRSNSGSGSTSPTAAAAETTTTPPPAPATTSSNSNTSASRAAARITPSQLTCLHRRPYSPTRRPRSRPSSRRLLLRLSRCSTSRRRCPRPRRRSALCCSRARSRRRPPLPPPSPTWRRSCPWTRGCSSSGTTRRRPRTGTPGAAGRTSRTRPSTYPSLV